LKIGQYLMKLGLKYYWFVFFRTRCTVEQRRRLIGLIYDNLDLFAVSISGIPQTDVLQHVIETGDAPPVRQRAYRQSSEITREMERQVNQMADAGIVEEADSPWNSPCLLIKKSGGKDFRFVSDMHNVNRLTKPVYYPIVTLEEVFDTVTENNPTIFATVDISQPSK